MGGGTLDYALLPELIIAAPPTGVNRGYANVSQVPALCKIVAHQKSLLLSGVGNQPLLAVQGEQPNAAVDAQFAWQLAADNPANPFYYPNHPQHKEGFPLQFTLELSWDRENATGDKPVAWSPTEALTGSFTLTVTGLRHPAFQGKPAQPIVATGTITATRTLPYTVTKTDVQ